MEFKIEKILFGDLPMASIFTFEGEDYCKVEEHSAVTPDIYLRVNAFRMKDGKMAYFEPFWWVEASEYWLFREKFINGEA